MAFADSAGGRPQRLFLKMSRNHNHVHRKISPKRTLATRQIFLDRWSPHAAIFPLNQIQQLVNYRCFRTSPTKIGHHSQQDSTIMKMKAKRISMAMKKCEKKANFSMKQEFSRSRLSPLRKKVSRMSKPLLDRGKPFCGGRFRAYVRKLTPHF